MRKWLHDMEPRADSPCNEHSYLSRRMRRKAASAFLLKSAAKRMCDKDAPHLGAHRFLASAHT